MTASDIPSGGWVDRLLPAPWRPWARLMRLDRPIGTWLLLLPCWWGLALAWKAGAGAAGAVEVAALFGLFALGAVVMRGAGCTVNDLWDRDFDRRVARTAGRPLASGAIGARPALAFLAAQLLAGLAVLLALNPLCWALGAASLALVFTYPLFKRVTYWPQFVLGLAFNWGALMGWAAVAGALSPACLLLYAAGIAWTLGYDTIYAHQDKEDDAVVGVKSSALALGARTRPFLWAMYGIALAGIAAAGLSAGLGWPFLALLAPAGAQLAWQASRVDIDDPADCLAKFRSNRLFGLLVAAAILAG